MNHSSSPTGKVATGEPLLALTVDIEPDWGISGSRAVCQTLPRLLELLDRHQASASFFVVSDMLSECAELLRRLDQRHEVGSHGCTHRKLDGLSEAEVTRELTESRARLESELGVEVSGVRAPFLRVPPGWLRLVAQAGYRYDSSRGSIYPSPKNVPSWRWAPLTDGPVVEAPTTTLRTGLIPFSLTYLRVTSPFGRALVPGGDAVFYLHPHELADRSLAGVLRPPLRWILKRNAGERAWTIVERLLESRRGGVVSCRGLLQRRGLLS